MNKDTIFVIINYGNEEYCFSSICNNLLFFLTSVMCYNKSHLLHCSIKGNKLKILSLTSLFLKNKFYNSIKNQQNT